MRNSIVKLFVLALVPVACHTESGGAALGDNSRRGAPRGLPFVAPQVAHGGVDCPSGGGQMVRVPEGFCIDATEVAGTAYFTWLAKAPSEDGQVGVCEGNTFEPSCQISLEAQPIGCVDWCDATAFCEDHGKRLCGAIGGGATAPDDYDDPAIDEWFAACSAGGQYEYPYGAEEVAHRCRDSPEEGWGPVEVGTFPECQSPDPDYAGVFDLGGNVAEWVNACNDDGCRIRGGSYNHSGIGMKCAMGERMRMEPTRDSFVGIGFRCCAD